MHPSKRIIGTAGRALAGTRIVLGICGSVAAYRAPDIARELMRQGAEVNCVMSGGAAQFIGEGVMHWATGNEVITKITGRIEHIEMCGKVEGRADVLLIAPATANTISEIAQGIDRGPVSLMASTALGSGMPVIIIPAMHGALYDNPILRGNMERLERAGVGFVMPRRKDGKAKIANTDEIVDVVARTVRGAEGKLQGKKIVVTAGASREYVDGVRFLSNASTGRMGVEIAREAWRHGADVVLVAGYLEIGVPDYMKVVKVTSAQEMLEAVIREEAEVYVLAGAPGDYVVRERKGKCDSKRPLELRGRPVRKIADEIAHRKPRAKLVIFKAETDRKHMEGNARKRMKECGAALVIANEVGCSKGFGDVEGEVLLIGRKTRRKVKGRKNAIAAEILNEVSTFWSKSGRRAASSGRPGRAAATRR